jgi:hypothetical protein
MRTKLAICGAGAVVVLLASLSTVWARPSKEAAEAAVSATVREYIEAFYTGDPARMEAALHPLYVKHTVSGPDGAARIKEQSGAEVLQAMRAIQGRVTPPAQRIAKITVLDVSGDVASAKLDTGEWVDYLTLAKIDGQWKIVSVLLRSTR